MKASTLHFTLSLLLLLGVAAPQALSGQAEPATSESAAAEDGGGVQGEFIDVVDVNIVNVEVYVTDKDGNRITGLSRDDFELEVDGKPMVISNFYAVENGELTAGGEPAPGPPKSEPPDPRLADVSQVPQEQRLHLVVYVDNFNLHPFTRNRVLGQVRTFLRTRLRAGDEVMLVTYERTLHTRVPFTSDPEIVANALFEVEELSAQGVQFDSDRRDMMRTVFEAESAADVRGRATMYAESIFSDMTFTLDALKALVDTLSGLPGRKAILYVSDGLPMRAGDDVFAAIFQRFPDASGILLEGQRYDLSRSFQSLTTLANASRVTFYTLEAAGLRTYSYLDAANATPGGGSRADQVHFTNIQSTLRMMADETGGMAMTNTNNFAPLLDRMGDDLASYYSLGFSSAGFREGRYQRIEVRVKGRKGLEVRHREGYRDKSITDRMADGTMAALHYGYQNNPLGVELELGEELARSDGQFLVTLRVKIPLANVSFVPQEAVQRGRLRLFIGAKDAEGGVAPVQEVPVPIDVPTAEMEQAREQFYQYEVQLLMRGGRQVIAIGVRDEIGAVTSVVTRGVRIGG